MENDDREAMGDFVLIDDELLDDYLDRTGRPRRRRQEPAPANVPQNIDMSDARVLDGVEPTRRARQRLSSRSVARRNVSSRDNRSGFLEKQIEKDEDTRMPAVIGMMDKTTVRMKDVLPIYNTSDVDKINYYYAPITAEIATRKPIAIRLTRNEVEAFLIGNNKIVSRYPVDISTMLGEFSDLISFPVIVTGFLVPGKAGPVLVLVDCLNYNGKYMGDIPYTTRIHRLHEIAGLLYTDGFKMLPIRFGNVKKFLAEQKNAPFFIIDANNVNKEGNALLSVARISVDGEKMDAEKIVVGTGNEETPQVQVTTVPDDTAQPVRVSGIEGKRVYVTGRVPGMDKDEIKRFIEASGGIFHPRVNAKLDMLVIAESPGMVKIEEAKLAGIPTMGWSDFKKLLGNPDVAA